MLWLIAVPWRRCAGLKLSLLCRRTEYCGEARPLAPFGNEAETLQPAEFSEAVLLADDDVTAGE